ncbi:unnamed protein product [Rotaria socialis]|uniref:Uncharacterized protein n=1 Tax=Rotaria socialis TaxID=392032 RepID=A0A821NV94_9BILA|nr:unnamed protein product [Rotaria socialis]
MIARGHVQEIYSSVEKLMNQYRLEKKYSTSFINLYRTLSEVIHNSSLPYEDDKLPIPDLSEGQFSRSDALALASFYKIALPNIEYEFVTNIVHFSSDSANLFNRINEEYSHIVP